MINAVTLCILVPWIDETGSWSVTAEAHCNKCAMFLLLMYICTWQGVQKSA